MNYGFYSSNLWWTISSRLVMYGVAAALIFWAGIDEPVHRCCPWGLCASAFNLRDQHVCHRPTPSFRLVLQRPAAHVSRSRSPPPHSAWLLVCRPASRSLGGRERGAGHLITRQQGLFQQVNRSLSYSPFCNTSDRMPPLLQLYWLCLQISEMSPPCEDTYVHRNV